MGGVLQNAHGVHEPVAALLRDHKGEILVVLQHGQVVAGVIGADGGVAALQLLIDLIHDERLIDAVFLRVRQQLEGLPQLTSIGGVQGIAQVQQGGGHGVPGVAEHQDVSGIPGIEHGAPAGDGLVHHGGVVDDAHGAPGIGDGVLVLRIIGQVFEAVGDLFKVGDVAVVQFREHILLNELGDHVVGGDDDVVVPGAAFQQGVEGLVALRRLIVDHDAGLFLKLGDQLLVDILAPAAHIDHGLGVGGAGQQAHRHHKGGGQDGGRAPAGQPAPGGGEGLGDLLRPGTAADLPAAQALQPGLPDIDDDQQQKHGHEQQGGNGVDLRRDPLFRHAVDGHGQGGGGRAGGEIADDEVVHAHGEGRQRAGDDAGLDLRQNDLPEGLHPGAAQVHGGVHQVFVHLPQLGAHGQNDIGDVEGHMGDEQRAEAQGQAGGQLHKVLRAVEPGREVGPEGEKRHKEQTHGDAGDDIGVHHGDVVDGVQHAAGAPAEAEKADGREGAGGGGDGGGQQGDQQGGVHALHDEPVRKELLIPVQGKTAPDDVAVALVEGKDDEQEDGGVQEQKHQGHEKAVEGGILSHSITACSSPSPKRFMTHMQTTTMTIITREMAAPSWGL